MANTDAKAPYIVAVTTNMYAGNFERDMTGFCTGAVGECEVGDDMAELFNEEVTEEQAEEFEDALSSLPDDRGCHRPCSIWNHAGNDGYNDVAMFFDRKPTKGMVELIKQRAVEFSNRDGYNGKMVINSVVLIKRKTTVKDTVLMELL